MDKIPSAHELKIRQVEALESIAKSLSGESDQWKIRATAAEEKLWKLKQAQKTENYE